MDNTKRKVPIKNVLYMFSYIRDKAEYFDYKNLSSNDDFDSVNILAELFLINSEIYLKRWIYREYAEKLDEIKSIKWKIDFTKSIDALSFQNAKAFCSFDELEANNLINQIIKTTAYLLYRSSWLNENLKRKLNNVLLYFSQVDIISITNNDFSKIKFHKNNVYCYYFIMVCKLINESAMLSENDGEYKFLNILDDDKKMHSVFEMFVYKFYKKHLDAEVYFQKQLEWNLKWESEKFLPIMKLDTYIEKADESIVIDTKYYWDAITTYYDSESFRSWNLYQLYTYLNHIKTDKPIRWILLYPFNWRNISESFETTLVNNKRWIVQIQTIDLSKKWKEIENNLLNIVNVVY